MKNVAACEAVASFQILRRDDLHPFHQTGKIRSVRGKRVDDPEAQFSPVRSPIAFLQLVRSKLHVGRENMLSIGRKGRIQNRRNRDVEIRRARQLAIFGVVKGTLQIINIRPDMNSSGERSERPLIRLKRGKTRQAAERKIHFRDIALCTEILNAIREHRVKLRGVDETKEGALR